MHAARTLGYAGLIPFVLLAAMAQFGPLPWQPVAKILLIQYGSLILAFVGALHWGYAVQSGADGGEAWARYGFSVLPALYAWLVLQFPVSRGLLLLAAGLVACLVVDYFFHRHRPLPSWLLRLRVVLTACGAGSLLLAGL